MLAWNGAGDAYREGMAAALNSVKASRSVVSYLGCQQLMNSKDPSDSSIL